MTQIKKDDVYKVKADCWLRIKNNRALLLRKNKSVILTDIIDRHVIININEAVYYTFYGEIIDLIEEGFLSLENKNMTICCSDNDNRSKIKYRIIHLLRSLLIENEYQSINEQLATWNVKPKEFNVSVYGDINWKDPGNYEKALNLIADKIAGE